MGDPKFARKKYETPTHPWQGARIKEEAEVIKKYGLKNKREVWKAETRLREIRGQARNLQALEGRGMAQAEKETEQLLGRLHRMGILDEGAHLDDVLALNVEAILNRRLQTQVYLKGLAATPQQARQLIVHGHVSIGGSRVTIPGYIVKRDEGPAIEYAAGSPLQDPDHPVRPTVDVVATGPGGNGAGGDAGEEDEGEEEAEAAEADGDQDDTAEADDASEDADEEAADGDDDTSDGGE